MITHLISKIREAGIDIRFMTDGQEALLKDLNNPLNKQVDYQLISSDNWFYSNAEHAVHAIAQDKATPTQWLAMLTKAGGIKAGEDRWLGLSDWLKVSTEKTLTKEDLLRYIDSHRIILHEDYYGELEMLPEYDELNKEYQDLIQISEERWKEADREYQQFMDDMQAIYGDDWQYEMTEAEREQEMLLVDERDDYDSSNVDQAERAFEDMVERHGSRFDNAFGYDNGSLVVGDEDEASRFLGVPMINETRRDYTTEGLTQYHELAFWTENTEPWHPKDSIHFGEAGQGKCIGWVRFGVTYCKKELTDEQIRARVDEMPKADKWNFEDGKQFVSGHDLYYPPHHNRYSHSDFISKNSDTAFVYCATDGTRILFDSLDKAVAHYNEKHVVRYENQNVLVIDEIQSARHQEGRDKGYAMSQKEMDGLQQEFEQAVTAKKNYDEHLRTKYATEYFGPHCTPEEMQTQADLLQKMNELKNRFFLDSLKVPQAPFEKNWHELCMKRMLRYAAEHGFHKVAWTKGEQQMERYNMAKVVETITREKDWDQDKYISIVCKNKMETGFYVKPDGLIYDSIGGWDGKHINAIFGKELAEKVMKMEVGETMDAKSITIGNVGMRTFYDTILPKFMNSYLRSWGEKAQDLVLPHLNYYSNAPEGDFTMHAVEVTPAMRQAMMQGQPMFMHDRKGQVMGCTVGDTIYLSRNGLNPETLLHEYTHVWAKVMQQRNPEGWKSVKELLRDTPLWSEVVHDPLYAHLRGDDDRIASEALARISGRDNAARLEQLASNSEAPRHIMDKLQRALETFWSWVAHNVFELKNFWSVNEVTDRVLYDLLNATRLTDTKVYEGLNGQTYIRCKVDGVQQMGIPLSPQDHEAAMDRNQLPELAGRYFAEALNTQNPSRNLKH